MNNFLIKGTGFVKNLLGSQIKLHHVNRGVWAVRPKEPFIQWAASVSREPVEEIRKSLSRDHSAYLLPSTDSAEPEEAILQAVYTTIFERELRDWQSDKNKWPKDRTYKTFQAWFDLVYYTTTLDLCDAPLKREPWDDEI